MTDSEPDLHLYERSLASVKLHMLVTKQALGNLFLACDQNHLFAPGGPQLAVGSSNTRNNKVTHTKVWGTKTNKCAGYVVGVPPGASI